MSTSISKEEKEGVDKMEDPQIEVSKLDVCDSILVDNFGDKLAEDEAEATTASANDSSPSINILANFLQHFELSNSKGGNESSDKKDKAEKEIMDFIENDNFDFNSTDLDVQTDECKNSSSENLSLPTETLMPVLDCDEPVLETGLISGSTEAEKTDEADEVEEKSSEVSPVETLRPPNSSEILPVDTSEPICSSDTTLGNTAAPSESSEVSVIETLGSSKVSEISLDHTLGPSKSSETSFVETLAPSKSSEISLVDTSGPSNSSKISLVETLGPSKLSEISFDETSGLSNSSEISLLETLGPSKLSEISLVETLGPSKFSEISLGETLEPFEENIEIKSKEPDENTEKNEVLTYIAETKQRIQTKLDIRSRNKNAIRPDEQTLAKLDSSLKKNTAFVKKVRNFTASQLDGLLKDMQTLNLSKYLSEIAAALIETKLKMSDIGAAVTLCSEINCKYSEFGKCMLEYWQKTLAQKKDEKVTNLSKLRVDLRFYADLISSGVFSCKEGLPLLGNVLTVLTTSSREDSSHISIIVSFCKYCGEDYAGLIPRRMRILAEKYNLEIPKSALIPPEKQKNVCALLKDYYANLQRHLLREHAEFQKLECQNQKILQTKGELSNEKRERSEMFSCNLQKLLTSVQNLAELVDEETVTLPENRQVVTETTGSITVTVSKNDILNKCSNLWEDEETQKFYQDYPDISSLVPASHKRHRESSKSETDVCEVAKLDDIKIEDEGDDPPKLDEKKDDDAEAEDSEPVNTNFKVLVDSLINGLTTCVNREMVDRIAAEFVLQLGVPNKHVRRKIVKTLFMVPRTRLDLLPLYARFVAVLNRIAPEINADLTYQLKQEFKYHVRKKDQINIESKVKTVRFIGELVKFGLYPKIEGLYCIKVLVHDFTHHNIEMACNLLETCGRYFFRDPETHQRTKIYLDQMMRKKSAMSLDIRYRNLVENCYFFINPPDNPIKRKKRPPLQQYIKQLIYQELSMKTEDFVLEQLRKLPWDNREIAQFSIICLSSAWKVKYLNIRCLANLIAGLVNYQEFVGTEVVDGVLEDVRIGLELNLPKLNQRRLAMVKYLGELYNYRLLESSDIFKALYSLISFGVSFDPKVVSPLDPPENLFRIKLVCTLLETCGQFFNHGMTKTKLDYFFIFFQNYYWQKYSNQIWTEQFKFPVNLTYLFQDTLLSLRPNFKLANTAEEATEAAQALQTKLMSKLPVSLLQTEVNSSSGLSTIVETGENSGNESADEIEDDFSDNEDAPSARFVDEDQTLNTESIALEQPVNGHDEMLNKVEDLDDEEDEDEEEIIDDDDDYDSDSEEIKDFNQESQSTEDIDFLNAFEQMVSDNMQDRINEVAKPPKVDIAIPLHFKSNNKKTYEQLMQTEEKDKNVVNFVLMLRKGSKPQCKTLNVPGNSELAVKLKSQEKAERIEMERVKQLTLNINNRLEEEDYQDQVLQNSRSSVVNLNRDRKQKYQHPKGAPDADAIFGRKKFR